MGKATTLPLLYRCGNRGCAKLLRQRDISKGVCLGHHVFLASDGTFLEWLKVKFWTLTGTL